MLFYLNINSQKYLHIMIIIQYNNRIIYKFYIWVIAQQTFVNKLSKISLMKQYVKISIQSKKLFRKCLSTKISSKVRLMKIFKQHLVRNNYQISVQELIQKTLKASKMPIISVYKQKKELILHILLLWVLQKTFISIDQRVQCDKLISINGSKINKLFITQKQTEYFQLDFLQNIILNSLKIIIYNDIQQKLFKYLMYVKRNKQGYKINDIDKLKKIALDLKKTLEGFTEYMNDMLYDEDQQTQQSDENLMINNVISRQKKQQNPQNQQDNEQRQMATYESNNFERKEARYQQIKIPIPKLMKNNQKKLQLQLERWLGFATKEIFSIGFNYFETKQFDEQDVKVFCSQNLLSNILEIIIKNDLTEKQISFINNVLRKQLLPYYSLKYPHSTEPQVNLAFATRVQQTDNFSANCNDLIYRTGIQFRYQTDKNYNPNIMKFLNELLKLYHKKISVNRDGVLKQYTLAKLFEIQMLQLFQMVQSQQNVKDMASFDPKNPPLRLSPSGGYSLSEQPDKYRQKVQSYTNFLINRKISKDVRQFTDQQISRGYMKLRIPSIMRIVTKWCGQLKKYFQNDDTVLYRSQPFRMRNKKENFLSKTYRVILKKLLAQQNRNINKFLNEIRENNIQSQKMFAKWAYSQNLSVFSDRQSVVGLFASAVRQNYEFYQLSYLNELIHSLLTVNQKFLKILYVEKIHPYKYSKYTSGDIGLYQLVKFVDETIDPSLIELQRQKLQAKIPQFISFKIGDLLRCRCFSKQKQIIALYSQLQKISYYDDQRMKIIRVKNKLEKGTKDILINIMFYDSIVIQVQLGVNQKLSEFSICANKFQHYLYELQRASFGPISQICNVWWIRDARGPFYRDKLQKKNIMNIKKGKLHVCEKVNPKIQVIDSLKVLIKHNQNQKNYQRIKLPFFCQFCESYYFVINTLEKHYTCRKCSKNICFMCHLYNQTQSSSPINQRISHHQKEVSLNGQIPVRGQILNLKSKKQQYKFFKKVQKDDYTYIFQVIDLQNKKFKLIKQMKSSDKLSQKKFHRNNIVIYSTETEQLLESVTDDVITKFYQIPQNLMKAYKKKMNSIAFVGQQITDQIISTISDIDSFPSIQKVSFEENQITLAAPIFKKFPNAIIINLNNNQIQAIPSQCEFMTDLRQLSLCQNSIKIIHDNIRFMKNLEILKLSQNPCLDYLPNSLTLLYNLTQLYLNQCVSLKKIPQSIGDLSKLIKLKIQNCQSLSYLPNSICRLKQLKQLNLRGCKKLQRLPDQFGNLQNLVELDLSDNEALIELPPTFQKLKQLEKLLIKNCQSITQLSEKFSKIQTIKNIELQNLPNLKKVPSLGNNQHLNSLKCTLFFQNRLNLFFSQFSPLHNLNLSFCTQIQAIPDSICNLKQLEILILRSCHNLIELPMRISQLIQLKKLNLQNCFNLRKLPTIFNFSDLQEIQFDGCRSVQKFPYDLGCFSKISSMSFRKNIRLIQLPCTTGSYLNSITLDLCLSLKQFPYSFINSSKLESIEIKNCTNLVYLCSGLHNLESLRSLIIQNCPNLIEFDESFVRIPHLQEMNIKKCHTIKKLQINSKLQKILISNCQGLNQINFIENSSLQSLSISFCDNLSQINGIEKWKKIKMLRISFCNKLGDFFQNIGQSEQLKYFIVQNCNSFVQFSDKFGNLKSMQKLQIIDCASFKQIGSFLGNLKKLHLLKLKNLNSLHKLPESIGQCSNLKVLQINKCKQLIQIPKSIINLKKLFSVILSNNPKLHLLPQISESAFPAINNFIINNCNNITAKLRNSTFYGKFDTQKLDYLLFNKNVVKKLNLVYLYGCEKLKSLPEQFNELTNLQCLKIKDCSMLTSISNNIFMNLRNLQSLYISNCHSLQQFPSKWGYLTKLHHIQFYNLRSLQLLGQQFNNLSSLRILKILQCPFLKQIPKNISQLHKTLSIFILTGNHILKQLPVGFGDLVHLQQICLKNNQKLLWLPSLSKLKMLKIVDLSLCHSLKALPQFPYELQTLLLGGGIEVLPPSIQMMKCLYSLQIEKAPNFKYIPNQISQLCNLTQVVIRQCPSLQNFPNQLINLSQLKILEVTIGKQISPQMQDIIEQKLKVNNKRQRILPQIQSAIQQMKLFRYLPIKFGQIISLQQLYLRQCQYLEQLPADLSNLINLRVFDIKGAILVQTIPIGIESKINLQILKCQECSSLRYLPDRISQMQNLRILKLKGCVNLKSLPKNFGQKNIKLRYLDLSFCQKIYSLPTTLENVSQLQYMNLTGLNKLIKICMNMFAKLLCLQELYFNGCHQLIEIPNSIASLRKLKILQIVNCHKIQELPNQLDNLISLEQLTISNCEKLRHLGDNFGRLVSLKFLEIKELPNLQTIPQSFEKLKDINFIGLNLQCKEKLSEENKQIIKTIMTLYYGRKSSEYGIKLSTSMKCKRQQK